MNNQTPADLLKEVQQLYVDAEKAIKMLEISEPLKHGLDITAINQLRYAGRHIVNAVAEIPPNKDELLKARGHCQRAMYDVYDIALIYLLEDFKFFADDYKTVPVSQVLPNYREIVRRVQECQDFIADCRVAEKDKRGDFFKRAQEWYEQLSEDWRILESARPDLNAIIFTQANDAKKHNTVTVLSMLGIVAALLVGFVAPSFTNHPSKIEPLAGEAQAASCPVESAN